MGQGHMTIDIVTFGCRLNIAESEVIRRQAAGVEDVVVVNTCNVTAEAVRQARQTIRRLKREQPERSIVVTGCAAQTAPEQFAGMAEVDRVLGNEEKLDARAWMTNERVAVGDIMAATQHRMHAVDHIEGHTRAFVQVQNGCDHRCTFCIIPFGRGNSRSLAMDDAVAQAQRLCGNGYREIVLTGVDITSYGADLAGAPRLGALVKRLLNEIPELARLRLRHVALSRRDLRRTQALATEDDRVVQVD